MLHLDICMALNLDSPVTIDTGMCVTINLDNICDTKLRHACYNTEPRHCCHNEPKLSVILRISATECPYISVSQILNISFILNLDTFVKPHVDIHTEPTCF